MHALALDIFEHAELLKYSMYVAAKHPTETKAHAFIYSSTSCRRTMEGELSALPLLAPALEYQSVSVCFSDPPARRFAFRVSR